MKTATTLIIGLMMSFAGMAYVESSNIHAMVKVESPYTNTIISIPWTDYTQFNTPDLNIRANRLVRPTNLTVGDILYVLDMSKFTSKHWYDFRTTDIGIDTYQGWILVDNENEPGCHWMPMTTVRTPNYIMDADDSTRLKRGYGVWLIRQNPNKGPFHLYGQWTSGGQKVTLIGGTSDVPGFTMLSNPDVSKDTWLGDYEWPDGENDTIIINTDHNTTRYLYHKAGNARRGTPAETRWCYCESRSEMIGSVSVVRSVYHYSDVEEDRKYFTIPKGIGFWYVRRTESNAEFEWKWNK